MSSLRRSSFHSALAGQCGRGLLTCLMLVVACHLSLGDDDAESPRPVFNLGHPGGVYGLACSPDGTRLAVGSGTYGRGRGSLTTWEIASREELEHVALHENAISCVDCSPDGKHLATASIGEFFRPANLILYRLEQGELAGIVFQSDEVFAFWDVQFSRDGATLIAAHDASRFTFWSVETGELEHTLDADNRGIAIAVSPAADEVACVDVSGTVQRIDTTTFEVIEKFSIGSYADAATYSADGARLLVGGGDFDSEAAAWTRTGVANRHISEQSTAFVETEQLPKAIALVDDTSLLVSTQDPDSKLNSGGPTSLIRMTLSPFEITGTYAMDARINCIAVAPDGQTILTGTQTGEVNVWDAAALGFEPRQE